MITLFLETSTATTGISITGNGRVLAQTILDAPGKLQNSWLLPQLVKLLESTGLSINQIDLFACTRGPGAFTGIRTGIATIQGLAIATGRPAIGVSSLEMLAMNFPHSSLPVCVMLDARKEEVYTAIFNVTELPETIAPEQAIKPDELLSSLSAPTIFVGDGALRYSDLIIARLGKNAIFPPPSHNTTDPSCGAILAESLFSTGAPSSPELLLPTYLRLSEAELSRQQKI